MSSPGWARGLLRWLAPADREDEVLGDLEEAHRRRIERRGRTIAALLTTLEALDMAFALLRRRIGRSSFSVLDFKLGLRMLVKHPGLTVVGGLAMAFGIAVGALTFEIVGQMVAPVLPLDEGDRIVGIRSLDVEEGRSTAPFLEDFTAWREALRTVSELGAFRTVSRHLIVDGAAAEPIEVAEMSAAGFAVARVPPLLGRTLLDADEGPDAPPVVVIGHETWQTRFGGDPDVVGRTVGVGVGAATVIGVMPEGFTFPVDHGVWIPLRRNPGGLQPGEGGRVAVFGRLAPGARIEDARAELDVLGARRAAAFPEALGHLRPRVMPFARSVRPLPDVGSVGLVAANVFMVMLLVLICGNVALLVFARAASREAEIAVRSALGAGRARIVAQLFAETLVLGAVAAVVGLFAAGLGTEWYVAMLKADAGGAIPFWIRDGIRPATVAYLSGLTVLAAAVAGVGPALKLTGRRVESRLRRVASGVGGFRLGPVWTVVIVTQVAVTVAFPAPAFFFRRYVQQIRSLDLGFAAEEYLSMRLEIGGTRQEAPPDRLVSAYTELESRLSAEQGVRGLTVANRLPGAAHPRSRIEIDIGEAGSEAVSAYRVAEAAVDVDFFRVFGAPVRVGRGFDSGDPAPDARAVIVNRAFVDEVLQGRSAVGRRVRYAAPGGGEPGPWLEIVGVADDLGMVGGDLEVRDEPGLYRPLAPGETYPLELAVHVRGDPDAFVPRLRTVAAAVDPNLRLHEIRRLDRVSESRWRESQFLYRLLTGISAVALILSLMTIYSILSFSVSRRTREIGVRVALGSSRRRIVLSIFRGPLARMVGGVSVGMLLVALIARGTLGPLTARDISLVVLYSAAMLAVCLLACVVPTRRALGVEPTEALRWE